MGVDLDQSTLYEILSELIKISLKEIVDDSLIVDAFLAKLRLSPCSRNPFLFLRLNDCVHLTFMNPEL